MDDSKPVYLTKKEREQLALLEKRKQMEANVSSSQNYSSATNSVGVNYMKDKQDSHSEGEIEAIDENEMKEIKARFMGSIKDEKKKRDKKFHFDWDESEDTYSKSAFYMGNTLGFQTGQANAAYGASRKRSFKDEFTVSKKKPDESHWTTKTLEEMKERDWRILKEDFNITTKGGSIPHPIRYWNESGLGRELLGIVKRVGYRDPTPIQRQAIPIALKNRDLIGVAETGSGKTAAFVLPMLVYISDSPKLTEETMLDGPYAIILAPTRELALQIEGETRKFADPLGFNCLAVVGGHSITDQSFNLRNGVEIVIATPGRLRDCLDRHIIVLNQCHFVVLDEADRMVDLGFEADLNYILDCLPSGNMKPDNETSENPISFFDRKMRQTIMFSATMPTEVERIARKFLRKPAVIYVGNVGQAVDRIEQKVEILSEEKKKQRLLQVLEEGYEAPIIIFANQKQKVDYIFQLLQKEGYKVIALHGGKHQEQREAAINMLKSGQKEILVATDVAGRGLDIKDVSLVINFDMAKSIEDYTHRIGRTGRAGKSGTSITFLTASDSDLFYDLKQMILKSPVSVVPSELMHHEAAMRKPGTLQAKKKSEETIFK